MPYSLKLELQQVKIKINQNTFVQGLQICRLIKNWLIATPVIEVQRVLNFSHYKLKGVKIKHYPGWTEMFGYILSLIWQERVFGQSNRNPPFPFPFHFTVKFFFF